MADFFLDNWRRYTRDGPGDAPKGKEHPIPDGREFEDRPFSGVPDSEDLPPQDTAERKEWVSARTGLNPDDEDVASSLEDPVLIAHMQAARNRLKMLEAQASAQKPHSTLRQNAVEVMGQLAAALLDSGDEITQCENKSDEIYIIAGHLSKVLAGRAMLPYFPEEPSIATSNDVVLKSISAKNKDIVQKSADAIKQNLKKWRKKNNGLSALRVGIVKLLDDYRDHVEFLEKRIKSQQELLNVASAASSAPLDPQVSRLVFPHRHRKNKPPYYFTPQHTSSQLPPVSE